MKTIRRFFGWFFVVIGAVGLFQQPIAGLVLLSWGLLLLPFTNRLMTKQGWQLPIWKRLAIVGVGMVLVNMTSPQQPLAPQTVAQQPSPSTAPTQIVAEVDSSDPSADAETPSPAIELSKAERFRQQFYAEVDQLASSPLDTKYAYETMQAWENQIGGVEAGFENTCADIVDYEGDAEAIAQSAYEVNERAFPLEQLRVHYKGKFAAAQFVGCER